VLWCLFRILRASLAQIDTEMAEKYSKLAKIYAELGKAAKLRSIIPYRRKESGYRAQKLISSSKTSMSRHLLTCNISSKSMHTFLSILHTDRQTDRQTNELGRAGKNIYQPPPLLEVNKDYDDDEHSTFAPGSTLSLLPLFAGGSECSKERKFSGAKVPVGESSRE